MSSVFLIGKCLTKLIIHLRRDKLYWYHSGVGSNTLYTKLLKIQLFPQGINTTIFKLSNTNAVFQTHTNCETIICLR